MGLMDSAIIAVMLFSALVGFWRGFIREVFSLASWLVALWVAYSYAPVAAVYLLDYIEQPLARVTTAFIAIFMVVLIITAMLGKWFGKVRSFTGIDSVDRLLGMLFGIGRGVVLIALVILMATFMELTSQLWWQESTLIEHFTPLAEFLESLMSTDLATSLEVEVTDALE